MTAKQKQVYDVIVEFIGKRGYPPTVREIGAITGHAASNTQRKLNALRKAGWIEWENGKTRTIRILKVAA